MKVLVPITSLVFSVFGNLAFAEDISGVWKNIDDKTGSSKAVLEMRKEKWFLYCKSYQSYAKTWL